MVRGLLILERSAPCFVVNTAQKIIISTIGSASGKHGMALPYKSMMDGTSEYCMEGLPAWLKLRKPKDYGPTQLKNIISFEHTTFGTIIAHILAYILTLEFSFAYIISFHL